VKALLQTRAPQDTRPVVIMAEDEGRFGRIDRPRRCWAPKPLRPTVPRQIVREFVYVFAAVCAQLGRLTSLILPTADTDMMNVFLTHVAREFAGYFIILVVDRAGWHTTARLTVPENLRLLPQPARSPELNPAEHVWEDLREKNLANKSFSSLRPLEHRLCEGLTQLAADPKRVRSLTDFPYMRVTL
jgi:DDE superfamily endonuclease